MNLEEILKALPKDMVINSKEYIELMEQTKKTVIENNTGFIDFMFFKILGNLQNQIASVLRNKEQERYSFKIREKVDTRLSAEECKICDAELFRKISAYLKERDWHCSEGQTKIYHPRKWLILADKSSYMMEIFVRVSTFK